MVWQRLLILFVAVSYLSSAVAQVSAAQPETYDSWIANYRLGPLSGALGDSHRIRMALTVIDGDDHKPDAKSVSMFGRDYRIMTTTFAVSEDGTVSMQRVTAMAIQGGGPGPLPPEDWKTLQPLIKDLPDDGARLPPKGRRLVAQLVTPSGTVARVYDRANAPEKILEMLRLVGADAWPIFAFPDFPPDERLSYAGWNEADFEKAGLAADAVGFWQRDSRVLATSADGRLSAVETSGAQYPDFTVHVEKLKEPREQPYRADMDTVLQIRDASTGSVIHEIRDPMSGRRSIYAYCARFTPDGSHLMILTSLPELRIYDSATWQLEPRLQGVPEGAVAYYPSTDWTRGVAVFPSGEGDLMDRDGRKLTRIDFGDELQSVAFSPNGGQVAVVTVRSQHGYHDAMRIWETRTGTLMRELRPLEATPRNGFGNPTWWPDGHYLLALTREGSSGPNVVGIWNAETGRYRGALVGCMYFDAPWTQFRLQGTTFYKTCNQQELLVWHVEQDIQKIADFEKSLAP
jgi:hypothetical protein